VPPHSEEAAVFLLAVLVTVGGRFAPTPLFEQRVLAGLATVPTHPAGTAYSEISTNPASDLRLDLDMGI
jgi:hypothetical protein